LCVQDEEYKTLFNVNQYCEGLGRPLHLATQHDADPEMCRLLVENGAKIQVSGEDSHPLNDAVDESNTEVVRVLLELGADPNFERSPEESYSWDNNPRCTDTAILWGETEILPLLLQHKAFVGSGKLVDDDTSLCYVSRIANEIERLKCPFANFWLNIPRRPTTAIAL
jgi:Ankyrin repeats (3 copies)